MCALLMFQAPTRKEKKQQLLEITNEYSRLLTKIHDYLQKYDEDPT